MGRNIEYFTERLESTRLPEVREQALAWLRSRYEGRRIEVVIFVGTTPTDILPGVPVVYVGNSPSEFINRSSNSENYVAIWFKVDVKKTIEVARRLQPKAHKVIVISGVGAKRSYLRKPGS